MDRGAWWAAVHGVMKSRTQLSDFTFIFHFHALEKEMATHSSVLAWRIPGTGEPGGLPSMGSHRVGHNWSNLAAAAAAECGGHWQCILLLHTKTKSKSNPYIYTPVLKAALFTKTKIWQQPKCPSTEEWTRRVICACVCAYNGILSQKIMKFCHLQKHGWSWRILC